MRSILRFVALALVAAAALVTGSARPAGAQPVSFQLRNDVAAGQKPTLDLMAMERVLDVRIDLERDDGMHFATKLPQLDAGRSASVPIGDGQPGKAHYKGKIALVVVGSGPWSYDLAFDTLVRAPLAIRYDQEHLDLAGRVLRFQLSRPAGKAELTVLGEDGREIGRGAASYDKEPAGAWLPIAWTQSAPGRVLKIKLHAVAADGLGAYLELVPWSVEIAHEDVEFDTDSAVIKPGEAGKLDASLVQIEDVVRRAERFVQVKLYVAGHTDTVGSGEHNRRLSLDRARAIAEYFRKKGLAIPIAYEGFGEDVPKVRTPDGTDEPRNRRADYVLGAAASPPPFGGAYRAARADWKSVK